MTRAEYNFRVMAYRTRGGAEEKRCPQCLEWQAFPSAYLGVRGKPVNWCAGCRARYKGWGTKTQAEKEEARALRRRDFASAGAFRVRWVAKSSNVKTGPIPITITERGSCPDACSLKGRGCYAEEQNWLRYHWERVPDVGVWWDELLTLVERLPEGQVWRHNEAGDLPGMDNVIARPALRALALANRGRRGFTFTHKPMTPDNAEAVREAVALGFTINLSADSIADADRLAALGVAPVSVVLPVDAPARASKTPGGHQLVVCPAQTTEGISCRTCRLCAVPNRKAIVGFRAHGNRSALVTEIVRSRRDGPAPRAVGDGVPRRYRTLRARDVPVPRPVPSAAAERQDRARAAVVAARARVAEILRRGREAAANAE